MNMSKVAKIAGALALMGVVPVASAQSADDLIARYEAFAGTRANAEKLVDGLRKGSEIVMTQTAPGVPLPGKKVSTTRVIEVTCTPQTGNMGYGNVDSALSLARSVLAAIKIVEVVTDPSLERTVKPSDICAALVGGDVVTRAGATISQAGILKLRADGLGWGAIANHEKVKLAP